jgi:hypothetical protein
MYTHSSQLKVARIYLRVSTEEQELTRQEGSSKLRERRATMSPGFTAKRPPVPVPTGRR